MPSHSSSLRSVSRFLFNFVSAAWLGSTALAGFDPSSVSGLVRWIEPGRESYADGTEITVLHDQSGNHNDLTQVQGTAGPLMNLHGANGLPEAVCTADVSRTLSGSPDATQAATTFAVVTVPGVNYTPFAYQDGDEWSQAASWDSHTAVGRVNFHYLPPSGNLLFFYPETMPTSGVHLFSVVSGPDYYEVYIDGVRQGRHPGGFNRGSKIALQGTTSIFLEYNVELSENDIAAINQGLSSKFGVQLGADFTQNRESGPGGWVWDTNPVLTPTQSWENYAAQEPSVLQLQDGTFVMAYTGGYFSAGTGWATSTDGVNWVTQDHPIVGLGYGGETVSIFRPELIQLNNTFYLFYSDNTGGGNLRRVESSDGGKTWTNNVTVLATNVFAGTPNDVVGWANSAVVVENGVWKMWVEASVKSAGPNWQTFYCESSDGIHFTSAAGSGDPHPQGPLLSLRRGNGMWGGPNVIKLDSTYHMWYHCSLGDPGPFTPTDIYHATSTDGINWTQIPDPVAFRLEDPTPGAQPGGVFYPVTGFGSQVADPTILPMQNGTTAIYFSRLKNENANFNPPKLTSEILRATFPGTISQLLNARGSSRPTAPVGVHVVRP